MVSCAWRVSCVVGEDRQLARAGSGSMRWTVGNDKRHRGGRHRRGRQPSRMPKAARDRARRRAGRALKRSAPPSADELLAAGGAERGTPIVVSPLDSYVSGRMITLAAPCSALMEKRPSDHDHDRISWSTTCPSRSRRSHYGAADCAVDAAERRPVGLDAHARIWSRRRRRRVVLVDHAEQAQSAIGSRIVPRSSRFSTTTTSARSRPGSR